MLTIRRIYLYLVAAISLIGLTWSVIGLGRLILSEGIGRGQITGLATWLAVIIVGLPIFLFHWLLAQRLAAKDESERGSIVRRLYLYGIMAAGATPIISNLYRLVNNGLLALLGGTYLNYYPYDLTTPELLVAIIIWGIVWAYIWRQVQLDNRLLFGGPAGEGIELGGIRRVYLLAFSLAGLVMVTWGAVGLLQVLLELSASVVWRTPIANNSAKLLIGGVTWIGHWYLTQQNFFTGSPAEERSVVRKIYLYLSVFVFSVMAVGSATNLLRRLLELALGAPLPDKPLLSLSIPFLIVGSVFWAYHWQVLRQDASQAPEAPRQASVRRIYAYLVAAIGLVILLSGVAGLLTTVVDLLTSPASIGLSYYREQVSLSVAMAVVGVPIWLIPWRRLQAVALTAAPAPEGSKSPAEEERRSTIRKIYLYFYVFVAALAVFSSVGWFVYHILTALLGADLPGDFITQVLNALVIALLAVGVWIYHWWAIRQDNQLEREDQAQRLSRIAVVVLDGEEGKLGQAIIHHLQHDLPGLQLKPIGITPQAAAAMEAEPLTAAGKSVETAQYIIGSSATLTSGDLASAVAASTALKLVVPAPGPNWIWAGIKSRSMDYYARQAARGVKQAIEGEEITPARDIDLTTVLAVIGGIILFLFVAGGLFALVVNSF